MMTNKTILTLALALSATTPIFAKEKKGERPSAAEIAAKMITNHDSDEDGKLSESELTAALTELHEKRKSRKSKK